MDPASAAGLAIGVASLSFEMFDRSVKLFRFFSSMVDMPKEYERCRLQLMIEYNRLLAWGDAVGLIDVPSGSNVASSLGTNAFELCCIVSHIGWLLEEFKDISDRWTNEPYPFQARKRTTTEEEAERVDLSKQVSSLATNYERNREKHKPSKGVNRLTAWMVKGAENAKDIINHPLRARWVMVDKSAFEKLLKDLHSLIERILELMSDYHGKQIYETTAKAYREMVVMRNDLCELKDMFEAVAGTMSISTSTCSPGASKHNKNNENLRDLLLLKKIKCVSDEVLLKIGKGFELNIEEDLKGVINISRFDGGLFSNLFTPTGLEDREATHAPYRPRGVLIKEGKNYEVWIEWREAEEADGSEEGKESLLRTATLAQMLSISKPQHLFSPSCIGYVDDRKRHKQLGWIFEMPQGSQQGTQLKTLRSMLGQKQHKPTLVQRVALAWKLASSLLYLHTADWLHKGIHSGNVLFSSEKDIFDLEKPILSGFEYSRPQSNKTTSRSLDPKWGIYRWPGIQSEAPNAGNSRKLYDVYSLGLLLLEIAHWQPLDKLLSLRRWPSPSGQDARIRGWLLDQAPFPPFKNENPLLELRDIAGDMYWEATRRCLVAHGEHGMRIKDECDQSRSPEIGLELQAAFTELVVEKLKAVLV